MIFGRVGDIFDWNECSANDGEDEDFHADVWKDGNAVDEHE